MNLIKRFLQFGAGNIVVLILGVVSSPIITRIIIPTEFGKFSMFNTITNLCLLIITVGIDQAFVRFFNEEKEENRTQLLVRSVRMPLIINMFFSVAILMLYKPISMFIIGEYSILIVLMIIVQNTFNILGRFLLLYIRMNQKAKIYSFLQVCGKIVYILSVVLLVKLFDNDYRTLVISIILSNIVITLIAIAINKNQWKTIKLNSNLNTKMGEMIKFGFPLVFATAITWIFQSIDKVFIGKFSGYTELGIYSAAFSIIALLNTLQTTFTTFWIPVAYERYKNNPEDKQFFSKVNSIITVVMMFMAITIILFKDILVFLLGRKYRGASMIFPFLVFMPMMYTISETTVLGISFAKKTKHNIVIAIVSAFTNVIGNIILVPGLGAKGAAISTGISYIIFFIMRTIFSKRYFVVNYNLKRLSMSLISVVMLALYASFNKINMILILLSLLSIVVVTCCYWFITKELFVQVKSLYKNKRKHY